MRFSDIKDSKFIGYTFPKQNCGLRPAGNKAKVTQQVGTPCVVQSDEESGDFVSQRLSVRAVDY